jgi:hypothetical protein
MTLSRLVRLQSNKKEESPAHDGNLLLSTEQKLMNPFKLTSAQKAFNLG